MGKFAIECPKCGSVNQASNFIFAKKVIKCGTCGNDIDVKASKLTSKVCPHCGKVFVYDQSKGPHTRCPNCGDKINAANISTAQYKMVTLNCPQCYCSIEADITKPEAFCPVCDCRFPVEQEYQKQQLVKAGQVSVIKFEGDNRTLIWKHPIEDFNLGTQLIVHESQEAIFFLNGEALDTFGPGKYSLETQSLPLLGSIYKMPTGKQSPFHAEVYFINKSAQMGIKWGTDSRVRFIDPMTQVPLDIGASGELNLKVKDGRKLLVKLVGTTDGLISKETFASRNELESQAGKSIKALQAFFRAPLLTEVKAYLANVIKEKNIDILEIDAHLGELSEALCARVSPRFEEYGLEIPQFFVTTVSLPEDDKNFQSLRKMRAQRYIDIKQAELEAEIARAQREKQLVEEETKARRKIIEQQGTTEAKKIEGFGQAEIERAKGLAEAEVMQAKGYTEKDVLGAEVQKEYAKGLGQFGSNAGGGNGGGGGGGVASDVLGMVVGLKAAGKMFDSMDGAMDPFGSKTGEAPAAKNTWTCPDCGERENTKAFCMNCGKPKPVVRAPGAWDCPACGSKNITSRFCPDCGAKKPEEKKPDSWDCPACGCKGITSKFCPDCGAKRPEEQKPDTWDCPECGCKGIASKFCPDCGTKKPEEKKPDTWDCPECGCKDIVSKFCPECGAKKPE